MIMYPQFISALFLSMEESRKTEFCMNDCISQTESYDIYITYSHVSSQFPRKTSKLHAHLLKSRISGLRVQAWLLCHDNRLTPFMKHSLLSGFLYPHSDVKFSVYQHNCNPSDSLCMHSRTRSFSVPLIGTRHFSISNQLPCGEWFLSTEAGEQLFTSSGIV